MQEIGDKLRYKKIGSGTVIDIVSRKFCGQDRQFIVIEFPHRAMKAQLPAGDPKITKNLFPVTERKALEAMIQHMHSQGKLLARTWNIRKEAGEEVISEGGPCEWIELLGSYSVAKGAGVPITASDKTLVENLIDLIAAEFCCASGKNFEESKEIIGLYYEDAAKKISQTDYQAEHFETMEAIPKLKRPTTLIRAEGRLRKFAKPIAVS